MSQPPPPPGDWGQPALNISVYADFWTRFVAWLIDGLILAVPNTLIQIATTQLTSYVTGALLAVGYAAFFIGSPSGQTVGMRVMSIRAVDASSYGRIDYGRCVIRYIVSIVSSLACLLGYLWMLWDPMRQTWHDKAANTIVVRTDEFPVERWPG